MPLPEDDREPAEFDDFEVWSDLRGGAAIESLSPLRRSLLFAELSHLVYWRDSEVRRICAHIDIEPAHYLDHDGAQTYILETPHDCVVACRGTEGNEWNDIRADLKAFLVLAETVGKVHEGFKTEADDIWPELEKILTANRKTLWFTGHSLGAAMAQIYAGRCAVSDIESMPRALYTYGSPRVGNREYINHVELDYTRWVNNNDLVTRVPPPIFGYRHTGREIYIDSKGRIRDVVGFARFRDRCAGFWKGLFRGRIDPFMDHLMPGYVLPIQNAIAAVEAKPTSKKG